MTNYRKTVTVTVKGLSEALRDIKFYDMATTKKIEAAVQDGVKEIARLARRRAPVDTGKLKKSIRSKFEEKSITGIAKAGARHAHLLEFGTAGVRVKPKNKKAMTIDSFGVRRYVGGEINLPAKKPHPFMIPSYEEEKPVIERKIAQALQEVKK